MVSGFAGVIFSLASSVLELLFVIDRDWKRLWGKNPHPGAEVYALAVNDTGMPGGGYDGAPECDLLHWPDQAWDCIVFEDYPTTVS